MAEPISFTARDFDSIKREFDAFVRATAPNEWSDFFESNLGMLLVDLAAMVGDVLSMSSDSTAVEMFLKTCRRYESGLRIAAEFGYIPRSATAATVTVVAITLPDSMVTNGGVFAAGIYIVGQNGLQYELQNDYSVQAGQTTVQLILKEGTTYTEQFAPTSQPGQEVASANFVVENDSWSVYVGDTALVANKWTQVDVVRNEAGPTHTYSVSFDGQGRMNVLFGDGNAGAIPSETITIVYRTCNGASGNAPVGAISGSLSATLNNSLGAVSVAFQNLDTNVTATLGTLLHNNESQGVTVASGIQTGTLLNLPASSGSVIITITSISGVLIFQDQADGRFLLVQNTMSGYVGTLTTSALNYASGAWSITLSVALAASLAMTVTYYSLSPTSTSSTTVGAATGGADRESLDELRVNIPAYVRSQNKIITLQDYASVLPQVPAAALVFPERYVSSYSANAVKLSIWSKEAVTFQTESGNGTTSQVPYSRYIELQADQVSAIQAFLNSRTLFSVHNMILRPGMLWVDVYLGQVTYDQTQPKQVISDAIAKAVVRVFEQSSGFVLRVSDVYNAVRAVTGVKFFQILRMAAGTQASSTEVTGQSTASPTISGTLQKRLVVPGSVSLSIAQPSNVPIVIRDDAAGGWIFVSGGVSLSVVSGSIDYHTGIFTVTFSAPISGNEPITAPYANVTRDYRAYQVVQLNGSVNNDAWPPPGTATTLPIVTPPYKDGLPLSATRPTSVPVTVTAITRAFSSGVVTATVQTAAPNDVVVGSTVLIIGAVPTSFSGEFVVTERVDSTHFKYTFPASVDPGVVSGTILSMLRVPAAPYLSGDMLYYDELQDIFSSLAGSNAHYYDETYQFNDEIYYDSVLTLTTDARSINLRRLVFDLVPG